MTDALFSHVKLNDIIFIQEDDHEKVQMTNPISKEKRLFNVFPDSVIKDPNDILGERCRVAEEDDYESDEETLAEAMEKVK